MLRYVNEGSLITVPLPGKYRKDGYVVECRFIYNKENDNYLLSMWLRRSDIDDKFKIDGQKIDTQIINGTRETIKINICQIVDQLTRNGFFDYYVDRFEYTYACFDRGNELFECEKVDLEVAQKNV